MDQGNAILFAGVIGALAGVGGAIGGAWMAGHLALKADAARRFSSDKRALYGRALVQLDQLLDQYTDEKPSPHADQALMAFVQTVDEITLVTSIAVAGKARVLVSTIIKYSMDKTTESKHKVFEGRTAFMLAAREDLIG